MATPVLNALNVKLAQRLGDPADTDGNPITVSNLVDGITYTNVFREAMLTESLRLYLNLFGHDQVHDAGFPLNYMEEKKETLPTGEAAITLPANLARVLYVDYYGRMAMLGSFEMLKRRHHVYWQKTPFYRLGVDGTNKVLRFYSRRTAPTDITIYYFRTIPDLFAGGPVDIELDPYHYPALISFAEALARRNHQEIAFGLQQLAKQALDQTKENL
jgi:hypothetical protein